MQVHKNRQLPTAIVVALIIVALAGLLVSYQILQTSSPTTSARAASPSLAAGGNNSTNVPGGCFSNININPVSLDTSNDGFTCSFQFGSNLSGFHLGCAVLDTNTGQPISGKNSLNNDIGCTFAGHNGNVANFTCHAPTTPGIYGVEGYMLPPSQQTSPTVTAGGASTTPTASASAAPSVTAEVLPNSCSSNRSIKTTLEVKAAPTVTISNSGTPTASGSASITPTDTVTPSASGSATPTGIPITSSVCTPPTIAWHNNNNLLENWTRTVNSVSNSSSWETIDLKLAPIVDSTVTIQIKTDGTQWQTQNYSANNIYTIQVTNQYGKDVNVHIKALMCYSHSSNVLTIKIPPATITSTPVALSPSAPPASPTPHKLSAALVAGGAVVIVIVVAGLFIGL